VLRRVAEHRLGDLRREPAASFLLQEHMHNGG